MSTVVVREREQVLQVVIIEDESTNKQQMFEFCKITTSVYLTLDQELVMHPFVVVYLLLVFIYCTVHEV
jgi:hypothetical protein